MRKVSSKRRRRAAEVRGMRQRLVNEADGCEICNHSPDNPNPSFPWELSKLVCHEILCGSGYREKALDQPYAILVICVYCNEHVVTNKGKWPQARQLATLQRRAKSRYDLVAFNKLANANAPDRITQAEVDEWAREQ